MRLPSTHVVAQGKQAPQRTQRAYLNAISSFLDYAARIGVSFIITPLLVSELGSILFGTWQVLNKMVSYMSAADGRPTQALKWVMAYHQESDDLAVKQRAIGSAIGVWLFILPLFTLIGSSLVWISPQVVQSPPELATLVRVACSLLVFDLMLAGLISLPESVLRGMNLGYKRMGLVAGMNVVGGLLVAGALHLDWGLVGVAGAHLLQSVLAGLVFWYLVKRYLPWFGVARVSRKEIRGFLGLSVWYAAWNVVDRLLLSSDVVILGIALSATVVTEYALTGYVAQTLTAATTMMVGAAAPGLGSLIGQHQYHRVVDLRAEMLRMSSLVAGVLGSMILLWNRSFIALWVGSEYYAGPAVNLLLVLISVQLLFVRNETYLIDLTLDVRRKSFLGLVAALLSIGLAAIFVQWWGVLGLCLGIIGGRSLLTVAYPSITAKFLGVSLSAQLKPVVRPTLVMGAVFAVSACVGRQVVVDDWIAFAGYVCISLLLVSPLFIGMAFSASHRKQLVKRVKSLRPSATDA